MHRRTSHRLFLRYLMIVLIPLAILIIVGTVSVAINQQYVSRQITAANRKALDQIRNNFNLTFDELDSLALSFSVSPDFVLSLNQVVTSKELTIEESKVLKTIRNFVDVAAYSRPYVDSIYAYVVNKDNKLLTTSTGIIALKSFYDKSWYRSFLDHRGNELEWTARRTLTRFPGVEKGRPVLSIFRRIYSLAGIQVPGVIVLNIDVDYLRHIIEGLQVSPYQRILIFDRRGQPLLSNFRSAPEVWKRFASLRSDGPERTTITLDGTEYVGLALRSSHYGWTYVSLTPDSVFYSASSRLRDLNMAIVLLSFISGSIMVYFASRRSFRQIDSVISVMQAAEHGSRLPPKPSAADDGFGNIAYSVLRSFVENRYVTVRRSEQKYRRRTLDLLALHSQMNPHFLFNALETINWKTIQVTQHPTEINEMIGKLSSILKYSLESPFKLETLASEIKHAQDYLAVQKIRYKSRFTATWECDPALDHYKVIRFLLQPLLENSICHGMSEGTAACAIEVRVMKDNDVIRIEVSDTGRGMSSGRLAEIRKFLQTDDHYSENIGLYNTNKRIQLAFGHQYGLRIDSSIGCGTTVMVEIPATA